MPQNIPDDLFKAPDDLFTSNESTKQPIQSTETKKPADRSWFDNVFSAPKFITDITGNVPEGGVLDAVKAIPDVASGLWNNPVETIKGGLTGMAQGAASQLSPANVASMAVPYIKPIKAAAPFINAGLGAGQFAKGISDVMGGDTVSGLGNIGFGALGMGTAGLPKFGTRGKLSSVAESVAGKTPLPKSTVLPESVSTQVPSTSVAQSIPTSNIATLPRDLRGAKPRYNMGQTSYEPQFNNDLDKSLFIIAQKNPSLRDADYLKFAMQQTGLSESEVRKLGQQVRQEIKTQLSGKEPGKVQLTSIYQKPNAPESIQGTGKPTTITVKKPTPELVKQLQKDGYTPSHITDEGYPVMKRDMSQDPINILKAKQAISEMEGPNRVNEIPPEKMTVYAETIDPKYNDRQVSPDEIQQLPPETVARSAANNAADAIEAKHNLPNGPEKDGIIRKTLGANKALLTANDFSAPGRQGKAFILNKAWWTSLDDMIKAWGSKEAADNINQSIIDHPSGYFKPTVDADGKAIKSLAEKVGLDLAGHEEMFNGNFGKKFAFGINKSSRAHTAFLNKLRSDQFVSFMNQAKQAGRNPETDLRLAKSYADFINDATGRGSLNVGQWKLERSARALNDIFFAPRNMSGQIRTWNRVLNPYMYAQADPVLRKQALRSLLAIAGTGLAVSELARQAGANVSSDPTNPDFRKIKIGNTRIDLFGGYQQFPVAAMKLLMGQQTSSTTGKTTDLTAGRFGQPNRASVAERFFTNRLGPLPSFIWAWMSNKEFDGKPFDVKRALYERIAPIAAKNIIELAQENPELAFLMTPTNLTGLAETSTYTGR